MTFILEHTPEGVDLVVTGDWSVQAQACLLSGEADGLVLNYARGFREPDLKFINALPIRRLDILARTLLDLSPIYSLADTLVSLRVQADPRAIIELERLPRLKAVASDWRQIQGSIQFALEVERIRIDDYTEPDLAPLVSLSSLVSVVLGGNPAVRSLAGIEQLPWLVEVGVYLGKDLEDIAPLGHFRSPLLEVLRFASCRKIADIAPVASCPALRFFELSEGSEIPTVSPLAGLDGLERLYLYGSTKIADGDLGPIARLPRLRDFRIKSRRGYSPPVPGILDAIARRAV